MIYFDIPKNLNGLQLADELDLPITAITITDGQLRIETDEANRSNIEKIIKAHVPKEQSLEDKLAVAGLTIAELKTALGL